MGGTRRIGFVCLAVVSCSVTGCGQKKTAGLPDRLPSPVTAADTEAAIASGLAEAAEAVPDRGRSIAESAESRIDPIPPMQENDSNLPESAINQLASSQAFQPEPELGSMTESNVDPMNPILGVDEATQDRTHGDDSPTETQSETQSGTRRAEGPAFRVWLPTTSGRMLIDVDIRVGGQPLVDAFDQRMASVMQQAGDPASLSWPELFRYVSSKPQQFGRSSSINAQEHRNLIRLFDRNRNKRADVNEVARFVFRGTGTSEPFRLVGSDFYRKINRTRSEVFAKIDRDGDRRLEISEIELADESIYRLDHNGDRCVELSEVESSSSRDEDSAWKNQRSSRWGEVAMDLTGYVDWQMFSYTVGDSFVRGPFGQPRSLFARLDSNEDARVDEAEVRHLLEIAPDIRLRIDFPNIPASEPAKIQIVSMLEELQRVTESSATSDQINIRGEGLRLVARVQDRRNGANPISAEAFAALDANNDGGLDEDEIPTPALRDYSFQDLDADEDGRLTFQELQQGMSPTAPIWSVQVRARAAESPDGVFAWLDENQDGVLSTREIAGTANRLRQIVAGREEIAAIDLPDAFLIQFGRGDPDRDAQFFAASPSKPDPPVSWPRWAQAMDANRDQDISTEEFVGTRVQFDTLDLNSDGFISPNELR